MPFQREAEIRRAIGLEIRREEAEGRLPHPFATMARDVMNDLDTVRSDRDAMIGTILAWWRGRRPVGWTEQQHEAQPFVNLTAEWEKPIAAMAAGVHRYAKEQA